MGGTGRWLEELCLGQMVHGNATVTCPDGLLTSKVPFEVGRSRFKRKNKESVHSHAR